MAGPQGPVPVDTGFIVYNERNYPNLTLLFDRLAIATEASDMSFSVHTPDGDLEYAGDNLRTLFAQKRNLVRPAFLRMLRDILRFNRLAPADLAAGRLDGLSLGRYLEAGGYGHELLRWYLLPMGAAIWSSSADLMLAFPAAHFVRFFANHGLLGITDRPRWRTVSGGSRRYVERIVAPLGDRLRLATPAARVRRDGDGVTVVDAAGHADRFDHVVLACHADQALALLDRPEPVERTVLGAFRYQRNRAILHRDAGQMPRRRGVWASWNYRMRSGGERDAVVCLTYWMNRLQNLDHASQLFVTVNPMTEPAADLVERTIDYTHPLFDAATDAAQRDLAAIQGIRRTWYCGSYFGYGFHEDAIESGLEAAEALGVRRPWPVPARRILSAAAPGPAAAVAPATVA